MFFLAKTDAHDTLLHINMELIDMSYVLKCTVVSLVISDIYQQISLKHMCHIYTDMYPLVS